MPSGGFTTRAVHTARAPRPRQQPVSPPIHPSAVWGAQTSADVGEVLTGGESGYVYGRYGNPTNDALHAQVAALHGAPAAWSTASGTAAVFAALDVLRHSTGRPRPVLAPTRLYGGTHALLARQSRTSGWEVRRADLHTEAGLASIGADLGVVHVETIANPTMAVADLRAVARRCEEADVPLVVDNTFASPWLCRPLDLGATVVVESATKHLAGHGDVVAGVVVASDEVLDRVREQTIEVGTHLGPLEAWLVSRGIQTLGLRMERACASALAIAEDLSRDPRVEAVHYPGLPGDPGHELARANFGGRGYGANLAFDLGERTTAERFADACEILTRGASLGGTHTLVTHPASSTHRQLDEAELRTAGIGPGLVRIAVGIEDAEDLRGDVGQALDEAV